MHKELLEDIGEKELVKRLARFMPQNQVSDDCAFVKAKNKDLLINTAVSYTHLTLPTICSV